MKPLELTIYPLIENEWTTTDYKGIPVHSRFDGYRTPSGDISEMFIDSHCREKRFTDAELAAEYYAQQMEAVRAVDRAYPWGESDETELETARIYILESFAARPHAHESDYQ